MAPGNRGRAGKFGKPQRGGGKKFSRNLAPLEADEGSDIPEGMWGDGNDQNAPASGEEEEEDEDSDEEGGNRPERTREERRAEKQARKDAARAKTLAAAPGSLPDDDSEEEEEEDVVKKGKNVVIATANPNAPGNSVEGQLTRKEREALDAAAAKERYWKLQEAGKTDQAKADLARLAVIRKEREEKARQRKAEMEEKKAAAQAKAAGSGRKQK